jgi:SPP1 gp7 family putative phage head morphogenesis protein
MPDPAYGSLQFREQIQFFLGKLSLPTATWRDIWQSAHDRAFVVAGAMKADLIDDLRMAVQKGIDQGTTLEAFRRDFEAIVAHHGWTGWTGESTKAGRAWRTRVIYETNLRTSYAAGRWAQLKAAGFPYLRYKHNDNVMVPRPHHLALDNKIFRADDPFLQHAAPPNGFGCKCWLEGVSEREMRRLGKTGPDTPPADWSADEGWGYAPGANAATPWRDLIDRKLFRLDAPIGAAMWERLKGVVADELRRALADMVDRVSRTQRANGESLLVAGVASATVADLARAHAVELESAGVWLRDHDLLHALRSSKEALGHALPAEVWRDLPRLLEEATPYLDTVDQALVFVFDAPNGTGKVVVRVNYSEKVRRDGKRERVTANFVRTGGVIAEADIRNSSRYIELAK